ncbi:bifunctional folylpolyglutamate synthase/dihydrofolate synthase [Candidatus Riflebacteria bacterium]
MDPITTYLIKKFGKPRKSDLSIFSQLLQKLGDPHKGLRYIHIAGTNGKGSCCAMLSYLLQQKWSRVGLFTSPHLKTLEERIVFNNKAISSSRLWEFIHHIESKTNGLAPTYFEVITAAAFLFFAEEQVDWAVIETGLGGRYDITNIIDSDISVLTNIGLEHQHELGNNLEDILHHKLGIIKPRTVHFSHKFCQKKLADFHMHYCRDKSARVFYTEPEALKFKKESEPELYFEYKGSPLYHLPLRGSFQKLNLLLVLHILEYLGIEFNPELEQRWHEVTWAGRYEYFSWNNNQILLDGAHNIPAIKALIASLKQDFPGMPYRFLFSQQQKKNWLEFLKELQKNSDEIAYFETPIARPLHAESIAEAGNGTLILSDKNAISDWLAEDYPGLTVICGSLFLVAYLKENAIVQ